MKNIFIILFTTCSYCIATPAIAQQEVPIKINLQITGDELGNATCEMQNKYTAKCKTNTLRPHGIFSPNLLGTILQLLKTI